MADTKIVLEVDTKKLRMKSLRDKPTLTNVEMKELLNLIIEMLGI